MDRFMIPRMWQTFLLLCVGTTLLLSQGLDNNKDTRKVLILVEGTTSPKSYAMGDGRQLAALLGHFNVSTAVQGVNDYVPHSMSGYDYTFYIGFHAKNRPPAKFLDDAIQTTTPLIWLHTGFVEFSAKYNVSRRYGFRATHIDSLGGFSVVKSDGNVFTKDEPNINIVQITDRARVEVLATAVSSTTRREIPYIVRSGELIYVADSPFASATATDRYLLFADMLHDILHEPHEESHTAIIRIEDVNPMENPDKLRDIADLLSSRGIPFLVGVIPFYVNPGEGVRVSLSDKPEIVDALKYMVHNGGTIVMHGTTHQYKGVTASDYEFWDESTNKPIRDENADAISRRIEMGIQEFMKNGLYPLAWETPHYTASFLFYKTIARYFSTAVEQRLSIEDFDYSQYFPYTIYHDLFGQRIYPENLGYVPLESDREKSQRHIQDLLAAAKTTLHVRDGFASCFFHAFVELNLLRELVEGIQALGYTYMDLREQTNWVKTKDRIILSGSQSYTLRLDDQYLFESYFDRNAELMQKVVSEKRVTGTVERTVELQPGQFYKAEPTEFRERELTMFQKAVQNVQQLYEKVFPPDAAWKEAKPVILWNHHAKGAAYNDQASLAAVFRSVNITIDTIFVGQQLDLSHHNLVVVPFAFVDSLQPVEYEVITKFVEHGGALITDAKNYLAEDFGIRFSTASLNVTRAQDRLFPEERISWRYSEPLRKFETADLDEVFCIDNLTEAPLVIGKKVGRGKLIFIGTRFDPYSQNGYSMYPFLLEYVRRYFKLGPIVRRDNLEMYFDPGFRHTQSVEHLVQLWVSTGIRRIHVAGWHEYPKYTYDYQRLITLAHANGILVYAWLEPPQVSQKFWLEHPGWREKNYKGEDVRPSWRYPVALTDSGCVVTLVDEYASFLQRYNWDGVNIAELYFESGKGLNDPLLFTPMHPSAQLEMRNRYNVELRSIFDPRSEYYWKANPAIKDAIVEYRIAVLDGVYEKLLDRITSIARIGDGFQIIVTAMDSFGSPELQEYIGVDMAGILRLQRKYGFLLQVEDPESRWSTDPLRYIEIGRKYAGMVDKSGNLLLDLNILAFRKVDAVTSFPTLIQTGTESFQLVRAASLGAPRATIYSESSVNPQDLIFFPYACASSIVYTGKENLYTMRSPYSFVLKLPAEITLVSVDDEHLSSTRDNRFLIPAGEHMITLGSETSRELSTHQIEPRIMSITANLLTQWNDMRTIVFEYEADGRALVSFNREPTAMQVDGSDHQFTPMKGNDCYSVFLPSGRHHIEVRMGDVFSYGINVTSFWSTIGIALFGLLAVISLVGMYAALVIVRRRTALARR